MSRCFDVGQVWLSSTPSRSLIQLSSGETHRIYAVAHVDASNFFPSSDCPEVMQCNAMQGSVMQACADRPRHRSVRSVSHSACCCCSTSHPARASECRTLCLPFLSLLPYHPTPDSLGKCMQVLIRAQSNLPTLLLSISLGPCSLGRIHTTAGE